MNSKFLLGFAVLALVMTGLACQAQARVSLGSAQDSKHAELQQGEQISFNVFLFNAHQEEPLEIYTGVISDGGLSVHIEPEHLTLPYIKPGIYQESEPGFVYLSTSQGYVKAKPVTIRVSVPLSAEPGMYEIVVYAATERQGGMLGSAQIRKFYFTVDVEGGESIGLGEGIQAGAGEEESPELPERPGEPEGEDPQGPAETPGEGGLPDSITGAVTGIPIFGPCVLAVVLLVFLVLRRLKRI